MINVKGAQGNFFDRASVVNAVNSATRRVLSKFGAFVRTRAKTSIRKRKKTSPPGGPPYSKTGTLRRFLFFSWDASSKSVVIGPERVGGAKDTGAPARLEYGGSIQGDGRTIHITNDVGRNTKGQFVSGGKTAVTLVGKIRYKARPFMGPALAQELPGLPAMWKDQVK